MGSDLEDVLGTLENSFSSACRFPNYLTASSTNWGFANQSRGLGLAAYAAYPFRRLKTVVKPWAHSIGKCDRNTAVPTLCKSQKQP
jgi:hypothetical protein